MASALLTGVLVIVAVATLIFSPLLLLYVRKELNWARYLVIAALAGSLLMLTLIVSVVYEFLWSPATAWPITALAFTAGVGVSIPRCLRFRSAFCGCLLVAFLIVITHMHFSDFTPVKPYKRFFAAVQNGMTPDSVLKALGTQFPQLGRYPVPELRQETNRMMFFLDPKKSAYNAEGAFLTLNSGKVITKTYSSD